MSDALASGSSSSSRLEHSVGMIPSYREGYFRKMSYRKARPPFQNDDSSAVLNPRAGPTLITTTASWTT
jgi:hypothetical protein